MKYPQIISLTFGFMVLGGCYLEKPVEIREIDLEPQLELQGYLSSGGIQAYVGQVFSPFRPPEDSTIEGIAITVYREGQPWTQMIEGSDGLYGLPAGFATEPQVGYHLLVQANDFPDVVTDVEYLIDAIPLDTIAFIPESAATLPSIYFAFHDPAASNNSYAWVVKSWLGGQLQPGLSPTRLEPNTIQDDTEWNGAYYVDRLSVLSQQVDSLSFTFFHVGHTVRNYFQLLSNAQNNNGDPLLNPPLIQGNVTGGNGFFGAIEYQSVVLDEF